MRQRSLFEYENKMNKLSNIGDPLEKLDKQIPWERIFRPIFNKMKKKDPKGPGGRPGYSKILMFKVLLIQRAYNLSDEQTEYQINDRLTFQRFLGIDLSCDVPDYSTIWKFREYLTTHNFVEKLFKKFNKHLEKEGYEMNSGSIIDASFVDVPKQRNSKDENKDIKNDKVPDGWSDKKKAHKDTDARWATKNKERHFGYKNHVKSDIKSKLITKYTITDASVHDSQELENLIETKDQNKKLYADSAYRSADAEKFLVRKKVVSKVHERGYRNKPLTKAQKKKNDKKSKIRARIEHIFGFIENSMGGSTMRCIDKTRGAAVIGFMNLTYNVFRSVQIQPA